MRRAGAVVVDAQIPTDGQWNAGELDVLTVGIQGRPGALPRQPPGTGAHARRRSSTSTSTMPATRCRYFGQDLFEQADAEGPLERSGLSRHAQHASASSPAPEGIDAALQAQQLDALIAPAAPAAWVADMINGDPTIPAGYGAAAVAGYPSLTVPMGDTQGLPLGMVFMGTAWSEPRLIELGYAFEQASKARKPPQFASTLNAATARNRGTLSAHRRQALERRLVGSLAHPGDDRQLGLLHGAPQSSIAARPAPRPACRAAPACARSASRSPAPARS